MKSIKFRQDWNGFKAGNIETLTKGLMTRLVRYGIAVEVVEKKEPKKKPRARRKRVERAITIEKE